MALFKVVEQNGQKKVHSAQDIPAGAELCLFSGEIIDFNTTLTLGEYESFAMQIDMDRYIFLDPPARYFNHSCEPNCGVRPDFRLIALRNIMAEEELRWDYSTTMMEKHWTMKCKCNASSCRETITDFDTLPKSLQKKYISMNIVQDYIIREIGRDMKEA
jgi:hypothetical protein